MIVFILQTVIGVPIALFLFLHLVMAMANSWAYGLLLGQRQFMRDYKVKEKQDE